MANDPDRLRRALQPPATYYDVRGTAPLAVSLAYRSLRRWLGPHRPELGLHEGRDLVVLEIARLEGRAAPKDIADALGMTTQSLATVLRRLEASGYVHRRRDPGDRRMLRLGLTADGAMAAYGAAALWREAEAEVVRELGPGTVEWLRRLALDAAAAWRVSLREAESAR